MKGVNFTELEFMMQNRKYVFRAAPESLYLEPQAVGRESNGHDTAFETSKSTLQ